MSKNSIGIVGGGNMGSAIIAGIHKSYKVYLCEKDKNRANNLKKKYNLSLESIEKLIKKAKIIILAVKPQDFDSVLDSIRRFILKDKLIISIAAGINTSYLEKKLDNVRVIRTMPNLPAQIGQGMTAISRGAFAKPVDVKIAKDIFDKIGQTVIIDEEYIDAVTAVSGSGPAYVFLFIECLHKAAKSLGLDEKVGKLLVAQTLKGSLSLLEKTNEDAEKLRLRVTSKGGTTQAAIDVFFKKRIDLVYKQALLAARRRAKELAKR